MSVDYIDQIESLVDTNGYSDEQLARLRAIVVRGRLSDCQIEDLAEYLDVDPAQLYPLED